MMWQGMAADVAVQNTSAVVRPPPREPLWLSATLGRTASGAGERDPTHGGGEQILVHPIVSRRERALSKTVTSNDPVLLDNECLTSWIVPVLQ